jgi:hypothetical protein
MKLSSPIPFPDSSGAVQLWTHWDGNVHLSHQLQPDEASTDTGISNLSLVRYEEGRLFRIPFPASFFFSLNDHASDVVKQEGIIIMQAVVRLHQHMFNDMGLNGSGETIP